jgi:hypothetical protein
MKNYSMSTIAEIEDSLRRLTPEELAAFWDWFVQLDAKSWDRQQGRPALQQNPRIPFPL